MIHTILHVLSWLMLIAGSCVCISGAVGVLRFPDFFTRMHAAGVTDTLGAGLILGGLMLQTTDYLVIVKLLLLLAFALLTSPTATYALAKSALLGNLRPLLDDATSRDERLE